MSLQGALAGFRPWSAAEKDRCRRLYASKGAKTTALILGRSLSSVHHMGPACGAFRKRRWSPSDIRLLQDLWGTIPLAALARRLNRTPNTVYVKVQTLGLPLGVPQGMEYLTHAAERTGYSIATLRHILKATGVPLKLTMSRPTRSKRHHHCVDPLDVDDAVAQWLSTEPIHAAARARGTSSQILTYWLEFARAQGRNVPPRPEQPKVHWRVPSKLIDDVLAWRSGFESVCAATRRVGVSRHHLTKMLLAAGVPRATAKPWFVEKAMVDRVVAERKAPRRKAA